jgi:hypothetical protein
MPERHRLHHRGEGGPGAEHGSPASYARMERGRGGAATSCCPETCKNLDNDNVVNRRRSHDRVQDACAHLKAYFGEMRTRAITPERVIAYVRQRQSEGAANATINRELAVLKPMFRLGEIAGLVARRPYVAMLREDNVRKGFFEPGEFRAVLAHLSDDLKPVFEVAYITGWRIRSELLTRQWAHVDFAAGWLRLEPGETKNTKGRMFPCTPDLRLSWSVNGPAPWRHRRREARSSHAGGRRSRSTGSRSRAFGGPPCGTWNARASHDPMRWPWSATGPRRPTGATRSATSRRSARARPSCRRCTQARPRARRRVRDQ